MSRIICNTLLYIALSFCMQLTVKAATLGLTTQDPTLGSSSIIVDYLEFGGDGDLSSFGARINSSNVIMPSGITDFSLSVAFPLAAPTIGSTGFFDVLDDNGQFLGGDLFAIGFTQDVIELQFINLIGSAADSFGNSVLALVIFDDQLGPNPFNGFRDGEFYVASVNILNVVAEPTILSVFLLALLLMGFTRFRCGSLM